MLPALPFQLLERYDVIEEIGRGGHAVVYRAHDRSLSRDVAVKILREDVLVPDIRARFTQEIQVLAKLQHAHILHVHDSGSYGNRPFVIMELAPAQTLAHRLEREPQLPIADAVQITREVASALAHAHERAVLHRDVKPENILLGPGGAILADFGIARVTGEMAISRITSTGEAVGTLQYMSPEQLCAEQVDPRSDQYSLACVLYEMLAGVRPHTAATFEGLRALRLTGRQAPVSVYRPSVAPMLEEVLQRAMAVTAADRYRSMDEFIMALDLSRTGDSAIVSGSFVRQTSGGRTMAAVVPEPVRRARWQVPTMLAVAVIGAAWLLKARTPAFAVGDAGASGLRVSLSAAADPLADSVRSRVERELSTWSGVRVEAGEGGAMRMSVSVTALSDSVQLRVQARGASGDVTATRMLARAALPGADGTIAALVREALAGRPASEVPGLDGIPDRSLPALRAYVRGHTLLRAGQLDSAAQAFRDARDTLPRFAQARFWAAQSAAWSAPKAVDRWKSDADEAVRIGALRGLDSLLAVGLQRMAAMDFVGACEAYGGATDGDSHSFVAWYGTGRCHQLDSLVIEGSSVRFRSSAWAALRAFREAVSAAPTAAWLDALYVPIQSATYSSGNTMKRGRGQQTGELYAALPGESADTIALLPVRLRLFEAGQGASVPETMMMAVRRGRTVSLDLTERWILRFPDSPEGWFRHAQSLEMVGRWADGRRAQTADATADHALARAWKLTRDQSLRASIAVAAVRLAVRRGNIEEAADSARHALVMFAGGEATELVRERMAPLAAFVADSTRFRVLTRSMFASDTSLPESLRRPFHEYWTAALFDDCRRTVAYADSLESKLSLSVARANLPSEREIRLHDPFRAGVPCLGFQRLSTFSAYLPLDNVYRALAAADTSGAISILRAVQKARTGTTNASITWDYLFAEAWAWSATGNSSEAVSRVLSALADPASMPLATFDNATTSAGFRRALLMLRSASPDRLSDTDAATLTAWRSRAAQLLPSPSAGASR